MGLHSVKADEKQMESTADGALDPWSCFKFVHMTDGVREQNQVI